MSDICFTLTELTDILAKMIREARETPLAIEISDYSVERWAGFLEGQVNALETFDAEIRNRARDGEGVWR